MSNSKKTSSLPRAQVAISELGKLVHINWLNLFPTLQIPQCSPSILDASSQRLASAILAAEDWDLERKSNSVALIKINRELNKACTQLKRYIQEQQPDRSFWPSEYASFGLIKNSSGNYTLPTDNARRRLSLNRLVDKLQNSNFAARTYGLAYWQQQQTAHSQLWDRSDRLRSSKSGLISEVANAYEALYPILQHIYDYMGFAYPKAEVSRRRREIGFLKESF